MPNNLTRLSREIELKKLRRLVLDSQALSQAKPFGDGLAGARDAISHLGYVQLDTIAVVERAHHHVLHSRVPSYKPEMMNKLLLAGDIFEYWSHAAAILPIADFRYSLPYKQAIKSGQVHWYKNPDRQLMDELLARIRSDGPIRSRDLENKNKASKQAGWWDWKPAKKALEQLYMEGDLMVCDREGFQKTYDLTEHVLPNGVNTTTPSIDDFAMHLLDQQLRSNGLASLKTSTYLRKNAALRKAVKSLIGERLALGELQELELPNGDRYVISSGALEQPAVRRNNSLKILSPFDNAVIQRERLSTVFGFEYQIECYVPEAKRRYGYFSLPLLYRGEFIGRMDCKAHRKDRHFEVKALYIENKPVDEEALIAAFTKAVRQFCQFQNCDTVSLTNAEPIHWTAKLRHALQQ